MAMRKVSVTLEDELLDEARLLAGGNLSGFVNEAVAQRIRQEHLRELLCADEAEYGPVAAEVLGDVRTQWPA